MIGQRHPNPKKNRIQRSQRSQIPTKTKISQRSLLRGSQRNLSRRRRIRVGAREVQRQMPGARLQVAPKSMLTLATVKRATPRGRSAKQAIPVSLMIGAWPLDVPRSMLIQVTA